MKNSLVLIAKIVLFVAVIIGYCALSLLTIALLSFKMHKARYFLRYFVMIVGKLGIILFGIKLTIRGMDSHPYKTKMIVANHTGYLDILLISSIFPGIFVTSKEMRESKGLGELCFLGGCHFVERRNPRNIIREIGEISETLKNKINIVLFPEAKSTDGSRIHEFKQPLFEASFKNKELVLPVCINYKKLDGEKITLKNRDTVFWYGDMNFITHALKLLSKRSLEVEVSIFEALDPRNFESRSTLADKAYKVISKEYENIV